MKITFDKGLETEKSIEVETINERIIDNRFTGSSNIRINNQNDFPEITGFESGLNFNTIEITNETMEIPIYGTYNKIILFTTQYSEGAKMFNLNIILGYEAITEATK